MTAYAPTITGRTKSSRKRTTSSSLSSYADRVLKAIDSGEFLIVPETKRNEITSLIKDGLDDISISRPADKIGWGIPVPERLQPSHVRMVRGAHELHHGPGISGT